MCFCECINWLFHKLLCKTVTRLPQKQVYSGLCNPGLTRGFVLFRKLILGGPHYSIKHSNPPYDTAFWHTSSRTLWSTYLHIYGDGQNPSRSPSRHGSWDQRFPSTATCKRRPTSTANFSLPFQILFDVGKAQLRRTPAWWSPYLKRNQIPWQNNLMSFGPTVQVATWDHAWACLNNQNRWWNDNHRSLI